MLQHENVFVSPLTDFKRVTFCLSKVNGKQWLCDSGLLLHTLLLGNERQPRYSEMHFCSTVFEVKFSVLVVIDRGKVKAVVEWQHFVLHLSPNRCIAVIQGPIEDCYQM